MKLFGFGPWGVAQVCKATSIPRRTLHNWHKRGFVTASEKQGERGDLRYTRNDVELISRLVVLRKFNIGVERGLEICRAQASFIDAVFYQPDRPIVSFGEPR